MFGQHVHVYVHVVINLAPKLSTYIPVLNLIVAFVVLFFNLPLARGEAKHDEYVLKMNRNNYVCASCVA